MSEIYIDASAGLSGETLLGALVQAAGWDDARLQREWARNPWSQWMRLTLSAHCAEGVHGWAICAQKTSPRHEIPQGHAALCRMLQQSKLPERAKIYAVCMADHYFAARAKLASTALEETYLTQDDQISLCLTAAMAMALAELAPQQIRCSPVCIGKAQGNAFDAPPPLVAQLLCGKPMQSGSGAGCTPAAAVAVAALADSFGPILELTARAFGYGLQQDATHAARVFVGEGAQQAQDVMLYEANLDDMTGEALGFALQCVLDAGALDAWTEPIYMKKNRPAVKFCALGKANEPRIVQAILAHTATLGVRSCRMARTVLPRRMATVHTPYGDIDVKLAQRGRDTTVKPEYDCVSRAALAHGVPYAKVYQAALDAAKSEQW